MTKSNSETYKVPTPCGFLYVTALYNDQNKIMKYLCRADKNGSCTSAMIGGVLSTINLALESGIDNDKLITNLVGISCKRPPSFDSWTGVYYSSCMDSLAASMIQLKRFPEQ